MPRARKKAATTKDFGMIGPVVEHEGFYWLLIPLEAGGRHFVKCAKGISVVEDGYLKIYIAATVAEGIGIRNGSKVHIDNCNGKLNVRLARRPRSQKAARPRKKNAVQ